ncbi:hypothetical protein [Dyella sp.]|uniref:hypothetical protein n=1 Tax=Dyella sp. TaxID=1869338 RepID=UPI002B474201|nr:hypothetical protein [Dyella sp.]HKT30223.1 hypothetical protein [Dyella sp.]
MYQPAYVFFIVMPDLARETFGKAPPGARLGLGVVDMTGYAGTITKQRMNFNDFSFAFAALG